MARHGITLMVAGMAVSLFLGASPVHAADDVKVYRDVPTPDEVTTILGRPLKMRGIEFPKVQPPQGSAATPASATTAAPPSAQPPSSPAVPSTAAAAVAAPAATERESETARAIAFQLNFAFNSAEIGPDAMPYLDAVGTAIKSEQLASAVIVIEGHTDAVGSEAYNQLLSQRRADSVKRYLVGKFEVNPKKLIAVGKGKSELLDPNAPESGINRRVQFQRAE